jgi:hypothetical protein
VAFRIRKCIDLWNQRDDCCRGCDGAASACEQRDMCAAAAAVTVKNLGARCSSSLLPTGIDVQLVTPSVFSCEGAKFFES